jgi:hypothetical protein
VSFPRSTDALCESLLIRFHDDHQVTTQNSSECVFLAVCREEKMEEKKSLNKFFSASV